MRSRPRFDAAMVRDMLLLKGMALSDDCTSSRSGFIRYTHRPFDNRWLYWEADTKLLNEKRTDYKPHTFTKNKWLSAAPRLRKDATEPQAAVTSHMASLHLIEWGSNMFPAWLRDVEVGGADAAMVPNLSSVARRYVDRLDATVEDLFHHILAVLHDPAYREANAGAFGLEWPRIPLPGWPNGSSKGAAAALAESAARGRELARLLDPDAPVDGVTTGTLRPEIAAVARPATLDGRNMAGDDFVLTAGWGRHGAGDAVMPGQGRVVERPFTADERAALGDALPALGDATFDVHLNGRAFWANVPAAVWSYRLGGYQVLKKWLSYRERPVLGRPLQPDEVQHFTDTARRIAAILRVTGAGTTVHGAR